MTVANSHNQNSILLSEKFIKEHMPYAPGEYLKVYISGLGLNLYKKALVSDIASALNQRETDVVAALEYWQGKGLLTIKNQDVVWVEFLDAPNKSLKPSSALYKDKQYNDMLQKLFGTHILKTKEFEMIYDWTDQFGLPKEVCLMVVEYSLQRKGRSVSIRYMDAVAKSWAEKRIDSLESASEEIERHERINGGANKVLSFLGGYGRLPSKPEMDYYAKWTDEWGFTLDSILTAIQDIGATTNPSFKYIDAILESFRDKGALTSRKVSETREKQTKRRDDAKSLLSMLDMNASELNLKKIERFKAMGFSLAVIKLAFVEGAKKSKVNLNYIETILKNWKDQKLTTKAKITKHLSSQKTFRDSAYAFYKKAGINQSLSDSQLKSFFTWSQEDGFKSDMMDEVADYAKTAKNPYQYMAKIFENLNEKGIKTKQGFLDQKTAFNINGNSPNKNDYIRSNYSPEDFQHILTDIEKEAEGEK